LRTFQLALATCLLSSSIVSAVELVQPLNRVQLIYFPWQGPLDLPPRFRNHCRFDVTYGRYYCSNHCGADYQFYYCSQASFGCCHVGAGRCDWNGLLRCWP
jgi:hypothetical protein